MRIPIRQSRSCPDFDFDSRSLHARTCSSQGKCSTGSGIQVRPLQRRVWFELARGMPSQAHVVHTSGGRPVQTSCTPCRLCRLFKPFKTTENKTLEFRSREVGDVIRPIKLIGIRKEPVQHGEKGGIFNV